ncbi:hypothetical protein BDN71DRAFT_1434167 [Pleurotus eryngii]|uniref:Uncharacterized protein n=1 Tax=Pleurotus eryngii TaxID=5323 RepID=A0A9P6D4S8_PLEER|nr:hypothetical protein BDN71DRAFT_1434167 [Pleurotus eryngii]
MATAGSKENQLLKLPRKCNFGAQLDALFATSGDMMNDFVQNFDCLHFRPLAPPTMAMRDHARALWLAFQTKVLGSREAAEFVFYAAVTGSSRLGIADVTGWSYKTTKTFVGALWGMAVQEWAKKDCKINTHAHSKWSICEQDLVEILTLCLLPTTTSIVKNFMRVQLMVLLMFTYQQGTHIGSLVEASQYEGTSQCLKWGNIEFVAFGWDENTGLGVQSFIKLRWNKGQHMLMLLSLGITRDIFETDVLALHKERPTGQMPISLKVKASVRDKPVWLSGNEKKAWTAAGASKLLRKQTKKLGWQGPADMHLPKAYLGRYQRKSNLKYLMGHSINTDLAYTTYQVPDHPVDVMSSCYADKGENTNNIIEATLRDDILLNQAIKAYTIAEEKVFKQFGSRTWSLDESLQEDEDVVMMAQPTISGLQHMTSKSLKGMTAGFSEESILQAFAEASNPIQMTVQNKKDNNPHFTILQQYISLIVIDKIQLSDVTNKCHKHHITQHGWTCESSKHPNTWWCPICAQHIPIEDKKIDYSSEERQEIEEVFNLHCKGCYEAFLKEDVQEDSDSESDKEEAQPSIPNKFGPVKNYLITWWHTGRHQEPSKRIDQELVLCITWSSSVGFLLVAELSDSCSLVLEQEFCYDEDASLDFSLHQVLMPPIALVNHWKNDLKKRVQNVIRAWVKPSMDEAIVNEKPSIGRLKHSRNISPSPTPATDEDPGTFIPSAIASHQWKKCMQIESPMSSPS